VSVVPPLPPHDAPSRKPCPAVLAKPRAAAIPWPMLEPRSRATAAPCCAAVSAVFRAAYHSAAWNTAASSGMMIVQAMTAASTASPESSR
jgi:hypothetical protein